MLVSNILLFHEHIGFEVFTAVIMKSSVFWGNGSACHLLHAGFLLDLFFDPEDGGEMFFRNFG
jgi:hypothetical protein